VHFTPALRFMARSSPGAVSMNMVNKGFSGFSLETLYLGPV